MKSFFTIFLLFALGVSAQDAEKYCIENLHTLTKPSNWMQKTVKLSKAEKQNIFKVIFQDSSFSFEKVIDESKVPDSSSVEGVWDSSFIAQHYFIDLDNDNDLDVVFSGSHYTGSTEGNCDVYINKNKKYLKKISSNGKITFAAGKIDSVYSIVVYRYPVANRTEHVLELFTCEKDKVNSVTALTFFGEPPPDLHESAAIEIPFNTVLKVSTRNPKSPPLLTELGTLKQVNQFKLTVPFKSYASLKDKNGEEWYFVKIRSKDLIEPRYPEWKTILAWIKKP